MSMEKAALRPSWRSIGRISAALTALAGQACADDRLAGPAELAQEETSATDASVAGGDAGGPVAPRDPTPGGGGIDAGTAQQADLGKGDGLDVITIGDSWMSLGRVGIQQSLVRISGQPYRTYGVGGTRLLNGVIPGQYARAKREDSDIKTVVMTGGGNDLLQTSSGNDCSTAGPNCRAQIDRVATGLVTLWQEMARDGVQDVVFIQYSRGGRNEASVNYGTEKIRPLCADAPLDCHWVDSDEFIERQLRDGIHPTNEGYDALGRAVFALMQKEGMRR